MTGGPPIPAMTSQAERECYYRLVSDAVGNGAIIEFGAWLGASTAYIAAAIRDSGKDIRAEVYDKFQSKKGHIKKVNEFYAKEGIHTGAMPIGDAYQHFLANLGPLKAFVKAHKCQIEDVKWGDEPIALIINDAPKRVPAISAILTNFRKGIREGTVMAWQDFCHFPSYEIPACLYRLGDHLKFEESVVPGSTLVFKVRSVWEPEEVTGEALALRRWTPDAIADAWDYWLDFVPQEKAPLFRCGQAMFLSDIGHSQEAVAVLNTVRDDRAVIHKWDYLRRARPDFVIRYRPLFDCMSEVV